MSNRVDNWKNFLKDIDLTQRKFYELPIQQQQNLRDIFHIMYG